MRGLVRQKQKVYWSRITEKTQGLDRIKVYEKPVLFSFSVSSTAGTPEEIAAGIMTGILQALIEIFIHRKQTYFG